MTTTTPTAHRLAEAHAALSPFADVPAVRTALDAIAADVVHAVLDETRRERKRADSRRLGAVPQHKRRPVSAEARRHISEALLARNARVRAERAGRSNGSDGDPSFAPLVTTPAARPSSSLAYPNPAPVGTGADQ